MVEIVMLTEFFLLSLAFGVGFFSFLAKTSETGAGFLKVISGLCGGSALIAVILHLTYGSFTDVQTFLYSLGIISFTLVYFWHKDKKSPLMWFLYILHNLSFLLLLIEMNNSNTTHFFFAFTSILFLGSVTYAMIMGHWYLVTPRLSEKPLKYALYFMWIFMAIKLGWFVKGYLDNGDFFLSGTTKGGGYAFNYLMLLMRGVWGFLVLGVMSVFAYKLVAMRSIQSATGMLYAMTFFVFVAELISTYMFYEYGIFL